MNLQKIDFGWLETLPPGVPELPELPNVPEPDNEKKILKNGHEENGHGGKKISKNGIFGKLREKQGKEKGVEGKEDGDGEEKGGKEDKEKAEKEGEEEEKDIIPPVSLKELVIKNILVSAK